MCFVLHCSACTACSLGPVCFSGCLPAAHLPCDELSPSLSMSYLSLVHQTTTSISHRPSSPCCAAKAVWPSRAFIRQMINLHRCFRSQMITPFVLVPNSKMIFVDGSSIIFSSWNGVHFWTYPGISLPVDPEMFNNAHGSLGFGALLSTHWLYGNSLVIRNFSLLL